MKNKLKSFNPSTSDYIGEVTIASNEAIDIAIINAKSAAKHWRSIPIEQRVAIVSQAFEQLEPVHRDLAKLLSMEMGKDGGRSMGEVSGVIHSAEYIAENVASALKTVNISRSTEIQYSPLGVAAVISPWNYPLAMATNLIIPALVAGNSVIFKPSEETPLVADEMVAILNDYLPAHLLQIIHGDRTVGQYLVEGDINLIAFTGSQQAGKDIMKRASGSMKRLIMELGGNDPMIVMHDAYIEKAARFAVASSFENAGQMCVATERIYVDERVADVFEARVKAIASHYKTGAWNDMKANIGPLINNKQYQKVTAHINDAIEKGAKLVYGGETLKPPYVSPTVITGITTDMALESEETFGPVVAIARYQNLNEAITRANNSDYALGAVVFGSEGAAEVANQLEAGMVAINQSVGGEGDSPWVGAKQSGFGYRGSAQGHQQFAQVKVLSK